MSIEEVLDLDMLSFDALVQVGIRAEYQEKIETAWTMMIAAQGQQKDMKKWTNRMAEQAKLIDPTEKAARDARALKALAARGKL